MEGAMTHSRLRAAVSEWVSEFMLSVGSHIDKNSQLFMEFIFMDYIGPQWVKE